ncbi:aroma-sacti cluster domain-containing protein [Nannocystis radixulma]|uniref:Uncharacterized protein n=1 Tax=Nannocystis radixulma TaxID=2995305 RepID=A0ABT5BBY8_9BACT|nr:aroma-sacti cluster domain-containing protein [Nannocystis radixulma]MDC0670582.1 hypothetical protein [Nannocystis radixulma]
MSDEKKLDLATAKAIRLRNSGLQFDALNEDLRKQVALLDDDELAVLNSIKGKLNSGLPEKLKQAADTVGGFVW